jgi:hypothetical protein
MGGGFQLAIDGLELELQLVGELRTLAFLDLGLKKETEGDDDAEDADKHSSVGAAAEDSSEEEGEEEEESERSEERSTAAAEAEKGASTVDICAPPSAVAAVRRTGRRSFDLRAAVHSLSTH